MADRRVGKRSMGRRGRSIAESGTCNVCSAPCSSCMHLNLGFMRSKSDESSDETCHGTAASQTSVNEDDALRSSRVKPHKRSHNTDSEASSHINVTSSHGTLSEISQSTAIVTSDVSHDSKVAKMCGNMFHAGIGAEDRVSSAPRLALDQSNISNTGETLRHENKILSDGKAFNLSLDNRNKRVGSEELSDNSDIVSDPVSDESSKGQDSKILELCDAPSKEVKSRAVLDPLYNSENVNSPTRCKNLAAESNKADGNSSDEAFKYSGENENNEKSGDMAQEPNSPAISEHESDDSEMVEHDVKVCDICGDAGREDLLAICSKCSDGAEHTYCMREMLQEVPEGEWLCEECKFSEEAEQQKRASEANGKKETEANSVAQSFGKRRAGNAQAAPDAKRLAIESSIASPKSLSPSRIAALSRDSSFKSLDRGKTKLAHQTSFIKHSNNDVESTRSTGSQLPSTKGMLLKSNSFNMFNWKPKVKLVDDFVLPRKKGAKDDASLDIKEGSSVTVGKSRSFKSASVASSYGSDSKVKMVPSKFSHQQESKGSKQVKERSAFERKDLSKLDLPVSCSTTVRSAVSAPKVDQKLTPRGNSSRELKGLQSDSKSSSLTKQASNLTRNRVEILVTSVEASSTNQICNSAEQISNRTNSEDEPPSTSSGSGQGANEIAQDGLPRSRESRNLGEKSRETFVNRPRSDLLSDSKVLPMDAPPPSDNDLSIKRSSKEEMNKGNRLRAAVDAALRKKPSFCKNLGLDPSEGSLAFNSERTPQSQLPISKMIKNSISTEVTQEGQSIVRSDPYRQTISSNGKQLASTDAVFPPRSGELDVNVPSVKPFVRDWPLAATSILLKTSAIPEHEYIWQGGLEVQRCGNLPELHNGIQAHLSTLASSSKVLEMVNKFTERVPLIEVQRLSLWPAQFLESGAKEDHIALFFFAKDVESYEKSYKPLVDNMMKKDLGLKGNVDGVELLIFVSNQLPRNCQRWNMLFFLWGVFRGRKEGCSHLPKPICNSSLKAIPQDRDISKVLPKTHSFFKHSEKGSSGCESPCNSTGVVADQDLNKKESSNEQSSIGIEANSTRPKFASRVLAEGNMPSCLKEEHPLEERALDTGPTLLQATGTTHYGPSEDEKASSFISGNSLSRTVQPMNNKEMGVWVGAKDKKIPPVEDLTTSVRNFEAQPADHKNSLDKDLNQDQANNRKRPYLDLTEPPPESSLDGRDEIPLNDLNSVFADEESIKKRLRANFGGENPCSSSENISSGDGFASEKFEAGPRSLTEKRDHVSRDEGVIPKNLKNPQRHFFPMDLNRRTDFQLGDPRLHGVVPNLELALGAEETPPNVGILPFLSGTAKERDSRFNPQDKITGEEKEEDDAASLSLSLAFPFPEKEQTAGPVSNRKLGRQNTSSLLLFREFPEK